MGGFFGVASKENCIFDLFFGTDYHSHLGTRRAGMALYDEKEGFNRAIHNIENTPFRTKFDKDVNKMNGTLGMKKRLMRPTKNTASIKNSFPVWMFQGVPLGMPGGPSRHYDGMKNARRQGQCH